MNFSRKTLAGFLGAGLVLAGSTIPLVATGQEQTVAQAQPTPIVRPNKQQNSPARKQAQAAQSPKQSIFASVAAKLGSTEQQVRAAFTQARQERLAEKLEKLSEKLSPSLGLTTAQVKAGLQQGKSIAQLGAQGGKSRDALRTALLARMQSRLDKAVQRGKLTADQAAQKRQQLALHVDKLLDRSFVAKAKPAGR